VSSEQIDVTVENSPFAHGYIAATSPSDSLSETPICAPIKGMLSAIGPLLLDCDAVDVSETSCFAQTGEGPCRFSLKRAAA
jgi:predicted hydrocarbon binding protein